MRKPQEVTFSRFKNLFSSAPGREFLAILREARPAIRSGTEWEAQSTACVRKGWEQCEDFIYAMLDEEHDYWKE